jgi:formylglycine-generating enzyme required for sulfatase activity
MMRRASRYYGLRGTLLLLAVGLLSFFSYEAFGRWQAQHLRDRLLSADIHEVPAIVTAMRPYRPWVQPLLQQSLAATKDEDGPARLRLRLALAPQDDNQFDPLYQRLYVADPDELTVIVEQLKRLQPQELATRLHAVLANNQAKAEDRLRAACALAGCDAPADNQRARTWSATAPLLVTQLLSAIEKNPSHYKPLVESLRPAGSDLVPSLIAVYGANSRPEADRALVASLLTEFAADRKEQLADLLLNGTAKQFSILFDLLKDGGEPVPMVWLAELDKLAAVDAADAAKDQLAQRQAQAAVALFRVGGSERVWPLLQHQPDPTVRSYLLHRFSALSAAPAALFEKLVAQPEPEVSIRRALLLALGEYDLDRLPSAVKEAWPAKILQLYQEDADAGIHGAAEWLLRQWHQEVRLKDTKAAWMRDAADRVQRQANIQKMLAQEGSKQTPRWYVNSQGQTMIVIPGPVEFAMGSPASETGRSPMETRHQRRINRSFALADTPVTRAQYERFLKTDPKARAALNSGGGAEFLKLYSPQPECPLIVVNWYMAAEYCNWLSAQEGLPREQWCYEPNALPAVSVLVRSLGHLGASGHQVPLPALASVMAGRTLSAIYGDGMRLKPNYLHLAGYRLPTEAEWECACRAGAASRYCFGESVTLLDRYAHYTANSDNHTWPVAALKPNDWGLFDVHGNVWNWCLNIYHDYKLPRKAKVLEDNEELYDIRSIYSKESRLLRGGAFSFRSEAVRSAYRDRDAPETRNNDVGFRPARTLPHDSLTPLPPAEGGRRHEKK